MQVTLNLVEITVKHHHNDSEPAISVIERFRVTYDSPSFVTVPNHPGEYVVTDHSLIVVVNLVSNNWSVTHFRQDGYPLYSRHSALSSGFNFSVFTRDPSEDLPYLASLTYSHGVLAPHLDLNFSLV